MKNIKKYGKRAVSLLLASIIATSLVPMSSIEADAGIISSIMGEFDLNDTIFTENMVSSNSQTIFINRVDPGSPFRGDYSVTINDTSASSQNGYVNARVNVEYDDHYFWDLVDDSLKGYYDYSYQKGCGVYIYNYDNITMNSGEYGTFEFETPNYSNNLNFNMTGGKISRLVGGVGKNDNRRINIKNAEVGDYYGVGSNSSYSGNLITTISNSVVNNIYDVDNYKSDIRGYNYLSVYNSTVKNIYANYYKGNNLGSYRGHYGDIYIKVLDSNVGNIYVGTINKGVRRGYINSGNLVGAESFTDLVYIGKNGICKGNLDLATEHHSFEIPAGNTVTVYGNATYSNAITNYGTMIVQDGAQLNDVINYGTLIVKGEMNINHLTNYNRNAIIELHGFIGQGTKKISNYGTIKCYGDHSGWAHLDGYISSNSGSIMCYSDCTYKTPTGYTYIKYNILWDLHDVKVTNASSDKVHADEIYSCTFVPEDGFMLPKSISVGYKYMWDALKAGKHYSYDPYTGKFVLYKGAASEDITIRIIRTTSNPLYSKESGSPYYCEVELDNTRFLYDSEPITPTIKSINYISYGDVYKMDEGVDYTVEYKDNVEPGTGYVIIKGKHWYKYSHSVPFEIYQNELKEKADNSSEPYCTVELEEKSVTYDATEKEPNVSKVTYYAVDSSTNNYVPTVLTEGKDYTVSYSNNIEAGEGTVTITGIKQYKGKISKNFTIEKAEIKFAVVSGNCTAFTGSEQELNVKLTINGKELVEGIDYELKCPSGSMQFPDDTKTVVVQGIGNNFTGRSSFEWKIVALSLENLECKIYKNGEKLVYNGKPQTPKKCLLEVTTPSGEVWHCFGKWSSVTNVGDPITFTATGGLIDGTLEFTEDIMSPADMSWNVVCYDSETKYYTDEQQSPTLVAITNVGSYELVEGKDYTVSGTKTATESGTYKVTLTGKGNFIGENTVDWKINKIDISKAELIVKNIPSITFDAKAHTIDTELYYKFPNGKEVKIPGTWNEIRNIDDNAVFTVDTNSPYFYGEYKIANIIKRLDISEMIEFPETVKYSGFVYNYDELVNDSSEYKYSVTYDRTPLEPGVYTATISGIGNCTGTIERTFEITPAPLQVVLNLNYKYYDGTPSAELYNIKLIGVKASDDVTLEYSDIKVTLPGVNVGVYTEAEVTGLTLKGEDLSKYTFDLSNDVELRGPYGGEFKIYPQELFINAEDQRLYIGETPDQTMWNYEWGLDGVTISDIVLTADEENRRIIPSGGIVTNDETGEDVTANFDIRYFDGYLTLMCASHIPDKDGFCGICNGYQAADCNDNGTPDDEGDDYYEISNAGQLYWFAEQVNMYNMSSIRAKLVKDIAVNEDLTVENLREWTPINYLYADFDGNAHSISGLYVDSESDDVGFFGNHGYYEVKNLTIKNSYFKGNNNVGAIAGYTEGNFKNCAVMDDVTVIGNENVGGLIGQNMGSGEVANCMSLADVQGTLFVGGIIGLNYSNIKNCYTTASDLVGFQNDYYGSEISNSYYVSKEDDGLDNTIAVTDDDLASGKIAYLLQAKVTEEDIYDNEGNYIETVIPQIWGQKIGADETPVINGDIVYEVTGCTDKTIYSNTNKGGSHNVEITKGYDATCAESGLTDGAMCKDCGHTIETQKVIPAKGHKYDSDNYCTLCGLREPKQIYFKPNSEWLQNDSYLAICLISDDAEEIIKLKDTNGDGYYEATIDGKWDRFVFCQVSTSSGTDEANVLNHSHICIVPGKEYNCYTLADDELNYANGTWSNFTPVDNPLEEHTPEVVKGYDSTCTKTGLTDGSKCSKCGEILVEQTVIPLKEHTPEVVKGYDSTCTETGLTDGSKCSKCGKMLTEQKTISAKGHNYNSVGDCTACGEKAPIEKDNTLYFKPSSNWKQDDARFVAYVWTGDVNKFIDLQDTDNDGYYEFINDNNWQNIIFCRLASTAITDWNNVWNQTNDITIPTDGNNCYTVSEGAWSYGDGKWSKHLPVENYEIGDIDLDGRLTVRDATALAKYLAEFMNLTETQLLLSDVNADGYININDVTYIQMKLADLV